MPTVEALSSIFRPVEPITTERTPTRKDEHLEEFVNPDGSHRLLLTYPARFGTPSERKGYTIDEITFLPGGLTESGNNEVHVLKGMQPHIERVLEFPRESRFAPPALGVSALELSSGKPIFRSWYQVGEGAILRDDNRLELSMDAAGMQLPCKLYPDSVVRICDVVEAIKANETKKYDFSTLKTVTGSFELLGMPTQFPHSFQQIR